MLPPVVSVEYSAEDWRVIAGFLLYLRAGVLRALQSVSDPIAEAIPVWQAKQVRYYVNAEKVTRWLLSYTPYPVEPYQLWDGRTYVDRPRLGDPGRPVPGVQDDAPWLEPPVGP